MKNQRISRGCKSLPRSCRGLNEAEGAVYCQANLAYQCGAVNSSSICMRVGREGYYLPSFGPFKPAALSIGMTSPPGSSVAGASVFAPGLGASALGSFVL